jgi:hypothetical protein
LRATIATKSPLGNDADKMPVLQNRKATDLSLHHDSRGLNQGCVGSRGGHVATHHLFDQESVQYLSLGVLAIAKRARQRAAEEVALTNHPDKLLPLIVEHRQMARIRPSCMTSSANVNLSFLFSVVTSRLMILPTRSPSIFQSPSASQALPHFGYAQQSKGRLIKF